MFKHLADLGRSDLLAILQALTETKDKAVVDSRNPRYTKELRQQYAEQAERMSRLIEQLEQNDRTV